MPPTAKSDPIGAYIAAAPAAARTKLTQMRDTISKSAPGAIEGLKWGMPAFSYQRVLVTFKEFKHHIGFYPTPSAIVAFERDLKDYVTSTGAVQFPIDEPLPLPLIRKITKFRVKELLESDVKWRTTKPGARKK